MRFISLSLLTLFLLVSFAEASSLSQEAQLHYNKALKLSQQGLWKDAIPEFIKATKLSPKEGLLHANLGVALSQTAMYKEALFSFDRALQLGYDSSGLRYNRGVSFAHLNLLDEAVTELEKALSLDSRRVKTEYDLGILYNRQGNRKKAQEKVDTLFKRNNKLAKKLFDQIIPDYKVITVNDGGILKGRVTLTGPIPRARSFHLVHAPNIEFCARISDGKGHRLLFDFTVSQNRGLKDTVISLTNIKKGKPFPQKMQTFRIDRCRANNYIIGIKNSESILIENTDPIQHEIATYEVRNVYSDQTSNRPVIAKSSQVRTAFVRPDANEFTIKCNLHPFLQTHGYMVENPYYTVTDANGIFSIANIPPGTYEVVAWHTYIPEIKGRVTITADSETTMDFEFDGAKERRKLYQDDIEGYRFNTWFDSKKKFYGGPRIDDPVEELQAFCDKDHICSE
jgi:tetratricopeptide (TPR) repeat protein